LATSGADYLSLALFCSAAGTENVVVLLVVRAGAGRGVSGLSGPSFAGARVRTTAEFWDFWDRLRGRARRPQHQDQPGRIDGQLRNLRRTTRVYARTTVRDYWGQ
jgi:hypothetical protein